MLRGAKTISITAMIRLVFTNEHKIYNTSQGRITIDKNFMPILQEIRMYGIEAEKLPESSFMNCDNKEEASDCIFTPFIIGGDGDYTFNQINWTNMFIMKQLGCYVNPNIEDLLQVYNLNDLLEKLPAETRNIIDQEQQKYKVDRLIELSKPLEQKLYDLRKEVVNNTTELAYIKANIRQIMKALGIEKKIEPIIEKPQINMMNMEEMLKDLEEIEIKEVSRNNILKQSMDENIKQTRILSEEIKKGQEVINRNIWEIYKEIEKFDMEKYQEKHGITNKRKNKEISTEELEVKEANKIAEILYQTGSELDYLMEIMNPKKQEKQEDKKNKGISINMMNVLENIDDDEIEEVMGQEEEKIEQIRKEFQYATKINIKEDENLQINMERQVEPKNKKVLEFSEIKNKKELQSFLGLVNQARNYIPNLARLTAKISRLAGEKSIWTWNEQTKKIIEQIKKLCQNLPKLTIPIDNNVK